MTDPVHRNAPILRNALPTTDLSDVVTGERIGPVTPGEVLRTEFLEPLGISARALARDINVPPNRITEIINGERAISAETAVLLGFRFETSPEFWLRLQAAHDIEVARRISKEKINEQLLAFRNGMRSGENRGAGQVDTTQQDIARLERWAAELDAIA
jgi:addiction module HigA family antidote